MPFSSPMGEEVLSPTSPNTSRSLPQHQIKLSQHRAGQEREGEGNQTSPRQNLTHSGQRPSEEKENSKTRGQGLNIVTNFVKPQTVRQGAADHDKTQSSGLGLKKQHGGNVPTSRKASIETLGLGHQPSNKSLRTLGSKGRLGDLKRASSKWSNLSPSDRAVVIGISVSPEELAQQTPSPDQSPARTVGLSEQYAVDKRSPAMPTIVVTPAKEKAPWSHVEGESSTAERWKPASSVYSHVTLFNEPRAIESPIVPPIPPLPPDAQKHNANKQKGGRPKKGPPPRIVSTLTDIDDGESPDCQDAENPDTGKSQLKVLTKTSSMDTIATKHRSQGWWNHIVSPFFPKSPMTFKLSTPPKEAAPGILDSSQQEKNLQEARQSFPAPPDSAGLKSGHTSWTDSTLDADYEKKLEVGGFRDRTTMISDEPQENLTRDSSSLPAKFEGFGAASEYYEACLYDMHSQTPYFECQNHSCLPNTRPGGIAEPGNNDSRSIRNERQRSEMPDAGQQMELPLAAQQIPMNRFSAAFHEAIAPRSKQRPQSDATIIEDLEATPEVQEAHAAPVVRAPIPAPATQASFPKVNEDPQPLPKETPRPAAARTFSSNPDHTCVHSPQFSSPTSPSHHRPAFSPSHSESASGPNLNPINSPPRQVRTLKKYVAVLPPDPSPQPALEQPLSSGPLIPDAQGKVVEGVIPLQDVSKDDYVTSTTLKKSDSGRGLRKSSLDQPSLGDVHPPPRGSSETQKAQNHTPLDSANRVNVDLSRDIESPLTRGGRFHPAPEQDTVADLTASPSNASRRQPLNGFDNKAHESSPSSVLEQSKAAPWGLDTEPEHRSNSHSYGPTRDIYSRNTNPGHTTVADLYPPPRDPTYVQRKIEMDEKTSLPPREPKNHGLFAWTNCRNCFGGAKPKNKKEKKIMVAIAVGLLLLVVLILVLAMTLTMTKQGNKTSVPSQWLNLTNFPPMPTGVATIVQPNAVDEDPDCIQPSTMWSCALPKEEQQGLFPNAPNQPNFRVEISFQNGTNATANATIGNSSQVSKRSYGHMVNAVSAGDFIRRRLLYIRASFSNDQYTPSPAPPNLEDQSFLGNTTDENSQPFDGEFTPFFMSFEAATKLSSRLVKRQSSDSGNTTDAFPDPTKSIPPPDTNLDGTAAAANLYPYPSSQPLRLYNRGQDTEHYGFYTYFDRSIFLKSDVPLDPSQINDTVILPDDKEGGANETAASIRCTWAQTRFLVQIWTKKGNSATLLQSTNTTSKPHHHSSDNATTLTSSSANDFTQPGSFPYPVTITLDRHGGDINKKSVYCYGLDDGEHFNSTEKRYQEEDRGVGGQLVNPALAFADVNVTTAQGGPGGIDGGSGGCACRWQNFDTGL